MRTTLYALLTVVAGSAAVLSFAGLTALARLCGFGSLSPLLPLVIDAGAAAGTVTWLGARHAGVNRLGRNLALVLLAASVAFNAISHALSAYQASAPWWLVVVVAAVSPAVLASVVHLTATLARQGLRSAPPKLVGEPSTQSLELPTPDEPVEPTSAVAEKPSLTRAEVQAQMKALAMGDAARWGEREIRGGGTAGKKRMLTQFPQLSEHFADEASKEAKRLADEPAVRSVRRDVAT